MALVATANPGPVQDTLKRCGFHLWVGKILRRNWATHSLFLPWTEELTGLTGSQSQTQLKWLSIAKVCKELQNYDGHNISKYSVTLILNISTNSRLDICLFFKDGGIYIFLISDLSFKFVLALSPSEVLFPKLCNGTKVSTASVYFLGAVRTVIIFLSLHTQE